MDMALRRLGWPRAYLVTMPCCVSTDYIFTHNIEESGATETTMQSANTRNIRAIYRARSLMTRCLYLAPVFGDRLGLD